MLLKDLFIPFSTGFRFIGTGLGFIGTGFFFVSTGLSLIGTRFCFVSTGFCRFGAFAFLIYGII